MGVGGNGVGDGIGVGVQVGVEIGGEVGPVVDVGDRVAAVVAVALPITETVAVPTVVVSTGVAVFGLGNEQANKLTITETENTTLRVRLFIYHLPVHAVVCMHHG